MREMVRDKGYNIVFTGRVSDQELARLLRESWVNLHFSVTEGWGGYSVIEACASGTPTVAFRVPGLVDVIQDGYNGYLVNNISEFPDRILDIIGNLDRFSRASREFAERFTLDETARKWSQMLRGGMECLNDIYRPHMQCHIKIKYVTGLSRRDGEDP